MRYLKILLFLLVAVSACRKEKTNPPPKASTTNPDKPGGITGAQPTNNTTTPPNTPPTNGTPTPAPSGVVLFVSPAKDLLAPLGCFDKNAKTFLPEEDCLAFLPPKATLRGEAEKTIPFAPKKASDNCFMGKTFEGSENIAALWPPETEAKLLRPLPLAKPDAADKKLIEKAVRAKTKEAYQITSSLSLDINGDQKPDRIYSVVAKKTKKGEDLSNPFAFSALLMVDGKKAGSLTTILSSSNETFSLLGGVDLNLDGTLELWVEQTLFEEDIQVSRSQSLQQLLPEAVEEIASFGVC